MRKLTTRHSGETSRPSAIVTRGSSGLLPCPRLSSIVGLSDGMTQVLINAVTGKVKHYFKWTVRRLLRSRTCSCFRRLPLLDASHRQGCVAPDGAGAKLVAQAMQSVCDGGYRIAEETCEQRDTEFFAGRGERGVEAAQATATAKTKRGPSGVSGVPFAYAQGRQDDGARRDVMRGPAIAASERTVTSKSRHERFLIGPTALPFRGAAGRRSEFPFAPRQLPSTENGI